MVSLPFPPVPNLILLLRLGLLFNMEAGVTFSCGPCHDASPLQFSFLLSVRARELA